MNGPQHYRQGEALLTRCTELEPGPERAALATEAHAHFTAALVTLLAEEKFPDSIKWQEATQ